MYTVIHYENGIKRIACRTNNEFEANRWFKSAAVSVSCGLMEKAQLILTDTQKILKTT